jgi:hypothetical protein
MIAPVPYIFGPSFFARGGEKRRTKEEKYRSAEGRNLDCVKPTLSKYTKQATTSHPKGA